MLKTYDNENKPNTTTKWMVFKMMSFVIFLNIRVLAVKAIKYTLVFHLAFVAKFHKRNKNKNVFFFTKLDLKTNFFKSLANNLLKPLLIIGTKALQ